MGVVTKTATGRWMDLNVLYGVLVAIISLNTDSIMTRINVMRL